MKITELDEKAKERALDKLRYGIEFNGEAVIEDWKQILCCLGFTDIDIYWSGFCSQGDGACFVGYWELRRVNYNGLRGYLSEEKAEEYGRWFREKKALVAVAGEDGWAYTARLTHRGNYYHYNSVSIDVDICVDSGSETDPLFDSDEFREEFEEQCKDLMRQIYRDLEAEYDYQTSDEHLFEMAEANEYDFTEEGEWV